MFVVGFYSVTLCPGNNILNFDCIGEDISRKEKELELGKVCDF